MGTSLAGRPAPLLRVNGDDNSFRRKHSKEQTPQRAFDGANSARHPVDHSRCVTPLSLRRRHVAINLVEAPHVGGNHSSLGRRCIILDSRVFQPTKWQSILSSTGEHHDDNGTQWNVSNDQIVVEGDDIQMATITLKPGQTIRTRGGGSGLPDQWYPYEDRDCARSGITLSHQQSTLYD